MRQVALFGAGRIGSIHGKNIAALPGVRLKYVRDPSGNSASQLAADVGAMVGTSEQVFADPAVNVIAVTSSTNTHSDLITRSAASRKTAKHSSRNMLRTSAAKWSVPVTTSG